MRKIHLKNCQKVILMAVVMFCTLSSLYAQVGQTVTGVVKDTEGEPLIGVSVLEIGTSNGAITNLDGQYTLTLTKNKSVLAFSYIGYTKQEISVSGRKSIIVVMKEDAVGLQEVIVTGYGKTVTKDKLTAAISKVSSEVLERGVRANPLTALAGTVTGVRVTQTSGQPGSGPSIQVRAGASLDGKGSPLYIIDGVQKDDMKIIRPQILNADMLVFVTPLYYYGISSQLKILIDRFCAFNSSIQRRHMKSALLAAAWNSDDWTFEALKSHYQTLVRYLNLKDMGMVLGAGCGTPSMTRNSNFPQQAYMLGSKLQ